MDQNSMAEHTISKQLCIHYYVMDCKDPRLAVVPLGLNCSPTARFGIALASRVTPCQLNNPPNFIFLKKIFFHPRRYCCVWKELQVEENSERISFSKTCLLNTTLDVAMSNALLQDKWHVSPEKWNILNRRWFGKLVQPEKWHLGTINVFVTHSMLYFRLQ